VAFGSQNLRVDDDGLMTPAVGGWAETKYRLLVLYDELFLTGMKKKWDQRVYIDLYARKYGLPRIADLRVTPAAVRFLSVEPLLEDVGKLPLSGISWVIVGGESGPGARPMKEEWVLSIREQCKTANVPFFFKQWGGVHKKAAGRTLRGRTYDAFPARVHNPTLPSLLRFKHTIEIETAALVQLV